MISFRKIPVLLTTVLALMLGTSAGRAGLGGIQDGGAFFSEHAKAEASRIIGDVERTLKKDIVIETFAEIPDAVKSGADLADKAAASRLFVQWAEKQAKQQGVSGVYILLVKQPPHLQAVVGIQTLKQSFTAADRDTLASTMLTKLRAKQNDAALLDGVSFVSSTMRAHAAGHAAPVHRSDAGTAASGSSTGWILPVVIGLLVVWVIFGLIRSLSRTGGAGMPQGAGGGGFFSSLIGGMFGAAAGMWMYDQFFGSHGNAADRNDMTGGGDSGASEPDTDYSSSGGDFGGDSGGDSGGGFGGGDSGGFGGGDSGGGDF